MGRIQLQSGSFGEATIAWEALRPAAMNNVWKKIRPQCVQFQSVSQTDNVAQLQQSIVTLARNMAFVEADVDQLLRSHEEALSNEELMQLEQGPGGERGHRTHFAPTGHKRACSGFLAF